MKRLTLIISAIISFTAQGQSETVRNESGLRIEINQFDSLITSYSDMLYTLDSNDVNNWIEALRLYNTIYSDSVIICFLKDSLGTNIYKSYSEKFRQSVSVKQLASTLELTIGQLGSLYSPKHEIAYGHCGHPGHNHFQRGEHRPCSNRYILIRN